MFGRKKHHEDHDGWLKELFQNGNAGAEFMLPWTVDTYFTTMEALKKLFPPTELKTIVELHKDVTPDIAHLRQFHLIKHILEYPELDSLTAKNSTNPSVLENRCRRLDENQAAVLIVWASSFWLLPNTTETDLEKYVK